MPIGFTMPFARSTGSVGYFETTENELAAVEQDVRSLALTNWGERPMHFNLGFNLREFVFEPGRPEELRERVADRVLSQMSTWLPFVSVRELNVLFSEDEPDVPRNGFRLRVRFGLVGRPDLSSLFVQDFAQ